MFFPISDDDRRLVKPAYVTWALIALNVAAFVYQMSNPAFTYGYAAVPREITTGEDLVQPVLLQVAPGRAVEIPQTPGPVPIQLTLLTAMFMHGGLGHIGGNMLFLWIFGDNVEHRFGSVRFLAFYLASGLAASFAQIATDPGSVIPTLGASGAISGVLGAYLMLFPRNRVHAIFLFYVVSLPAYTVIGMWALTQLVNGYGSMFISQQTGGVAYAAHLGGFAAGLLAGWYARRQLPAEPPSAFYWVMQNDPRNRRR
ncbi:MAG: rhomboid family intramembrane serine protease [Planctomycetaceae bacterium]|nr:rhomboid family intramembrane serine protease [Planctomycetaceae bacterium]